jgi:hypothetical protein
MAQKPGGMPFITNEHHWLTRGLRHYFLFNEGSGTHIHDCVTRKAIPWDKHATATSQWITADEPWGAALELTQDAVGVNYDGGFRCGKNTHNAQNYTAIAVFRFTDATLVDTGDRVWARGDYASATRSAGRLSSAGASLVHQSFAGTATASTLTAGTWYHAAFVCKNGQLNVYLNGTPGTWATCVSAQDPLKQLTLFCNEQGAGGPAALTAGLTGALAFFGWWDIPFTTSQIVLHRSDPWQVHRLSSTRYFWNHHSLATAPSIGTGLGWLGTRTQRSDRRIVVQTKR